jgi:hypothetical protein
MQVHRRLRQAVEKLGPILVAPEQGFSSFARIQDVMVRAGKFDAEFSGHGGELSSERAGVNRMGDCVGLGDPLMVGTVGFEPTTF